MKKALLISTVFLLCVIGGGMFFISSPNLDSNKPIRIGLNPWPGYEFFYLAEKKGYYKEVGVNVDIIEYSSLEDVRYAFEKGQIDIMNSTIIELILSEERTKKRPKAFFVSDFSNGGDVILSKNYKSIKQLKGKNIAVEPHSLGLYMIARALQKENMSVNDVNLIGLTQLEMEEAFRNDKVDAVVSYPPVSISIINNIYGTNKIFSSAEIPGEIIDVASAEESFIQAKAKEIHLIISAWDKAVSYSKSNPDDAYRIMAAREKITPEEFGSVIDEMKVLFGNEQDAYLKKNGPVENAINLSSEMFLEIGFIKRKINGYDLINRILIEENKP